MSEPKRVKKLTSILPDSLDVITESSERSECSSSSEVKEQIVIRSPKRKGSIPKVASKPPSPRKSKAAVKAHYSSPEDSESDNVERSPRRGESARRGDTLGISPRRAIRKVKAVSSPRIIEDENDSTGATDKLTQSESEGSADIDEGVNYEIEDSEVSDDELPPRQNSALLDYLHKSAKKAEHKASHVEHASFDEDNSVMKFDYDGDDNDDGDFSCSKHSLSSARDGCDDDDLTWRADPTQSLSDWTITVINRGTQTAEHYHVHKNMLAVGKRKSDFFANVFQEQRKMAKRSNVTELRLPHTAADMIPALLDYVYAGDKGLTLSSETAPGLRYLSQYFGMRVLFERIMKFIHKDLSLKTLVSYYKGCTDLGDQKILGICARHTARNIHLIDASHNLMEVMDPLFFCSVTASPGLEGTDKKVHLSILVAKYCQLHKDILDESLFLQLTAEEHLPLIHHTAALCLLGMEADLVIATTVKSMMSMTSLQERCIKGLAANWRELTELDPAKTAQICRKLPAIVVTELMLKSLDSAKKDEARQTTTRVLVKRNANQKGKPLNETGMKIEHQDALAKLKQEFEQKTAHLQALCYEKDKHIKSYYEELARFQRVPNAPDGKLTVSGRTAQPTSMPTLAKHSVDGYLLTSRKKGSQKYPVFFYKGDEPEE